MPLPALASATQVETWRHLADHLSAWFYQPDLEALQVALAVASSHYSIQADPVWLFVIGVAGSGKTSLVINSLSKLPDAHIQGDLGTDTLLSAFGKRQDMGLLTRLGDSFILLFKDFSTFISKRAEHRGEIVAQLREVYDGRYVKERGVSRSLKWEGKATVIAAATPALEREWAVLRDLGERFCTVRLLRNGGPAMGRMAIRQRGHEREIAEQMRRLAQEFVDVPSLGAPLNPSVEQYEQIIYMAEVVAILRCKLIRDSHGQREIIDVPDPEEPTRLSKSLSLVAGAQAALWRLPELDESSMALARRVALDTIPHARQAVLNLLPIGVTMPVSRICEITKRTERQIEWVGDELSALHVINITSSPTYSYTLTDDFCHLLQNARIAAPLVM